MQNILNLFSAKNWKKNREAVFDGKYLRGGYNLYKQIISLFLLLFLVGLFGCNKTDDDIIYRKQPEYSIKYNLDGGYFPSNELNEYSQSEQDIILPLPIKAGYNFLGWLDEKGETITCIVANTTGDRTFTAVWEIKTYKIILDNSSATERTAWLDDGTFSERIIYVRYGDTLNIPKINNDDASYVNYDKYIFRYWYYVDSNNKVAQITTNEEFLVDE